MQINSVIKLTLIFVFHFLVKVTDDAGLQFSKK